MWLEPTIHHRGDLFMFPDELKISKYGFILQALFWLKYTDLS